MQRAVKMNMDSQQPENVTGAESAQTGSDEARCASATGSAPPSYEIKTVQDFLLVPEDRLEACLSEFRDYLEYARDIMELAKLAGEIVGAKETKSSVGSFNWTDDGLRKGTIRIETTVEQNVRMSDGGHET